MYSRKCQQYTRQKLPRGSFCPVYRLHFLFQFWNITSTEHLTCFQKHFFSLLLLVFYYYMYTSNLSLKHFVMSINVHWLIDFCMIYRHTDSASEVTITLLYCRKCTIIIQSLMQRTDAATCYFVANQLAAVNISHAGKQRPNVVLRHRLRQVIDNQVCQRLVVALVTVGITTVVQHGLLSSVLCNLHHSRTQPSIPI